MKCERCGQEFACGMKSNAGSCWCSEMPELQTISPEYKDCLCPACLKIFIKPKEIQLIEGEDFYFENGLMVMTAEFHLKRGFCCKNNCRNCPY